MTRVCFVSQVKPHLLAQYRARHAQVWPDMLAALRDTGWQDYRLFLSPTGLLVGTVTVDNYADAQARMAQTAPGALTEAVPTLPEPHASWMGALEAEWLKRYGTR